MTTVNQSTAKKKPHTTFPEVLYQKQISGPVNRANCQPVEPVDLPEQYDVFRKKGSSDEG